MNQQLNHFDQIERYLMSQMTEEEQERFQHYMERDRSLANEVEKYREFLAGFDQKEKKRLKNMLKALEAGPYTSWSLYRWAAVVASLLIIIGTSIWYIGYTGSPHEFANSLYQEYHQTYPNQLVGDIQGTPTNDASALKQGMYYYEKGAYRDAVPLLEKSVDKSNRSKSSIKFYLAQSWMELNKYDKAIDLLKPLSKKPHKYETETQWYLALSYLKTNKLTKAKNLLVDLADGNNDYSDRAKKIVQKLE